MAGLAQVGEVRDVGFAVVLVVLDVVGVAVFGVGGACDAAAVADGQDDSLGFRCAAYSAQGKLAPVAVEDGGQNLGIGGEFGKLTGGDGGAVVESGIGELPGDDVVVGCDHQIGHRSLAAHDQLAQGIRVALGKAVRG